MKGTPRERRARHEPETSPAGAPDASREPWARGTTQGVRLTVRAKPSARRSAVAGVVEGALVVELAAPPIDGAANEELRRVVSRALGVPRSAVDIAVGAAGRRKIVDVAGVTLEEVRRSLERP